MVNKNVFVGVFFSVTNKLPYMLHLSDTNILTCIKPVYKCIHACFKGYYDVSKFIKPTGKYKDPSSARFHRCCCPFYHKRAIFANSLQTLTSPTYMVFPTVCAHTQCTDKQNRFGNSAKQLATCCTKIYIFVVVFVSGSDFWTCALRPSPSAGECIIFFPVPVKETRHFFFCIVVKSISVCVNLLFENVPPTCRELNVKLPPVSLFTAHGAARGVG